MRGSGKARRVGYFRGGAQSLLGGLFRRLRHSGAHRRLLDDPTFLLGRAPAVLARSPGFCEFGDCVHDSVYGHSDICVPGASMASGMPGVYTVTIERLPVDARYPIITDTHVTLTSVHDSQPYLARLDRQRERFGFQVQAVGLDAGYFRPAICRGLEDRGIGGVLGYRLPNHKARFFYKRLRV
jgi:hypothetical protein